MSYSFGRSREARLREEFRREYYRQPVYEQLQISVDDYVEHELEEYKADLFWLGVMLAAFAAYGLLQLLPHHHLN